MGAIARGNYLFEPEHSVIAQNGAIHVYREGEFIDEIPFSFSGKYPELDKIEELVDDYCREKGV